MKSKKPATKKTKTTEKSKRGCKPTDVQELILKLYFNNPPKGMNAKQLYDWLDISHDTYYKILKSNDEFSEAVKDYTGQSHLAVLKSFKNLACGFTYDETEKELRKDKNTGEYKLTTTKVITKHVPPNPTAGIFYLKNKMPDHFKDKIEQQHSFAGDLENITFIIKGKGD